MEVINISNLIGLIGVAISIVCYACVQWRRDFVRSIHFSILNLFSSMFIGVSLLEEWNLAAFIINSAWGLISLYGIYRCMKYMYRDYVAQKSALAAAQATAEAANQPRPASR